MPIISKYFLILLLLILNFETILPLLLPITALVVLEIIICMPIIANKNKKVYNDFSGYLYLCSHLLLLIFTFGIWELVWISKTTKFINRFSDDKMNVVGNILLCLFVPFYFVAWSYKVSVRLDNYAYENGVDSNISPTCMLLSFFDTVTVSVLIQAKINETVYVVVKNKKMQKTVTTLQKIF